LKIKGRTIIELTDVKTGKVQRFEDNNAFMDSNIEQKFRNFGIFQTSVLENFASTPLWQKLCGGLLLLDSVVDANANFIALGQKMTGRGYYGSSNNGSPVNLGSWNATESAVSSNAVQMVYDFTTSQGNGDIKAVCLTSDYCGRIGLGNQDDDMDLSLRVQPLSWSQGGSASFNLLNAGFAFDGDFIYTNPVLNGTSLTIDKKYANAKKVDLIHTLTDSYTAGTISVTLPSAMTYTSNLRLRQVSKTKLVLIGYQNNALAFSIAIIDISGTPSATVTDVTDMPTLDASGAAYNYSAADVIGENASNQVLIAVGTFNTIPKCVVVNASTGAKQTFAYSDAWSEWTGQSNRYSANPYAIGNGFFILHGPGNAYAPSFMCDISANNGAGSIHPCECYGEDGVYFHGIDLLGRVDTSWIRPFSQNPFYLATINNLATPVTKTSSQTMKVTYVISRANS
jgi:hypothetical protein